MAPIRVMIPTAHLRTARQVHEPGQPLELYGAGAIGRLEADNATLGADPPPNPEQGTPALHQRQAGRTLRRRRKAEVRVDG